MGIVILKHLTRTAVLQVGAPGFERWLLGYEVAGGVEHEADADVEAARAVSVGHVIAAAVFGAKDGVEQG